VPADEGAMARTIFESLALKCRLVLEWLEELTGQPVTTLRVIGGGSRNRLLNQLIADASGRLVIAGPVEATALGNLAMQLLATRQLASLDDARDVIERSFPSARFEPRRTGEWDAGYRRLREYMALA
jgi:rhamnulokinase